MNEEETRGSLIFFFIMLTYLAIEPLANYLFDSRLFALIAKLLVVGTLLIFLRKWFPFKFKFDFLSIVVGVLIGVIWVGMDAFYNPLFLSSFYVYNLPEILLKLGTGLLIAPIVEEFFTRYFLHRFIQSKKWLLVPLGKFSLMPFIVTTLFFGLSHSQWLVGLFAGALLNLLWYKRKDMNSIILAHASANLVLWIFIIVFGLWHFWG